MPEADVRRNPLFLSTELSTASVDRCRKPFNHKGYSDSEQWMSLGVTILALRQKSN